MPTKEIEQITVNFIYNDKIYHLRTADIVDHSGKFICKCDLTGTIFYGDHDVMRGIAKICLTSYLNGFIEGQNAGAVAFKCICVVEFNIYRLALRRNE